MNNPNHINGQELQFGNIAQVRYVRRLQELFTGQRGFEPDYLLFWDYDSGGYEGQPAEPHNANQMRAYFYCQHHVCNCQLCFIKKYDSQSHYHLISQPWPNITCRGCGTEYRMNENDTIWIVDNQQLLT